MEYELQFAIGEGLQAWYDPDGGIVIRAVEPGGDPVELGSSEARELAEALLRFADAYDE